MLGMTACGSIKTPTVTSSHSEATHQGIIVALGDSLTEGYLLHENQAYPALLEQKLKANGYNYNVINAGISGEISRGTLSRVDEILASYNPNIVILEIGVNDAGWAIKFEHTYQNISQIVDRLQAHGSIVVLAGMESLIPMDNAYMAAFDEMYVRIAKEKNIILIPSFLEGVVDNPNLNLFDGMHPNAEGYKVICDTVYPYIIEAIE